ncbi:hypothetical protein [Candidatus Ichthyocystis sparus]|uniref:hypothetical protein n=1 Tax=Candidatus Ichthyocystis sparus TaxID=1561004 RepID=UPI000B88DCCA|nr:hypothetical protein [Candidatus Ichthyocystis sparus]
MITSNKVTIVISIMILIIFVVSAVFIAIILKDVVLIPGLDQGLAIKTAGYIGASIVILSIAYLIMINEMIENPI